MRSEFSVSVQYNCDRMSYLKRNDDFSRLQFVRHDTDATTYFFKTAERRRRSRNEGGTESSFYGTQKTGRFLWQQMAESWHGCEETLVPDGGGCVLIKIVHRRK